MSPELDEAIRAGLCICFPNDAAVFSQTRAWHGSAPAYSVVVEQDHQVIAHVGVVQRTLRVGSGPLSIAGVQNVFVLPDHRGRGLADRIMTAAMDQALRRRIDVGLLFCLPTLERLYRRLGWLALGQREVWATHSAGQRYRPDPKNVLMFHPLLRRDFPAGPIDLCGDDW